ncbi:MAG: hypothetical protein K5637_05975 [Lachnospiraceae bacterium]|nr:hypothetical protein [Lachnospiraceae bacterium]
MPAKGKDDFWDDTVTNGVNPAEDGGEYKEPWSAIKSLPFKIIMRILLMIACLAALVCGYIIYNYVQDRSVTGSLSNDFYKSREFTNEFNESVGNVLSLLQTIETDPTLLDEGNEEMLKNQLENYKLNSTNFSFYIQNADLSLVTSSGNDAKDRIESSGHYCKITTAEINTDSEPVTTLPSKALDKDEWSKALGALNGDYVIYTAVDNELTYQDSFYTAYQKFNQQQEYFGYARIVGIVALVLFIICLIFCVLSTGMKRGYEGVQLNWFDYIPTEIALAIMGAVGYGLFYLLKRFNGMEGDMYRYITYGMIVVIYAWAAQSYFSIVRRLKSGRFFRKSIIGMIIGGIIRGIGSLPKALCIILSVIIIAAINAGWIYLLLNRTGYEFRGIPIEYIIAAAVVIAELITIIIHNHDKALRREAAEAEAAQAITGEGSKAIEAQEGAAVQAEAAEAAETQEGSPEEKADWETVDLGQSIAEAERQRDEKNGALDLEAGTRKPQETLVLSEEDIQKAIQSSGEEGSGEWNYGPGSGEFEDTGEIVMGAAGAEQAGPEAFDLVQMIKDVRKGYKPNLKNMEVVASVRAPGKPVMVEANRADIEDAVGDIFSEMLRISAGRVKNTIEVCVSGGKAVCLTKINVDELMLDDAKDAETDGSFDSTKNTIEKNGGRFIVNYADKVLKTGFLVNCAKEEESSTAE